MPVTWKSLKISGLLVWGTASFSGQWSELGFCHGPFWWSPIRISFATSGVWTLIFGSDWSFWVTWLFTTSLIGQNQLQFIISAYENVLMNLKMKLKFALLNIINTSKIVIYDLNYMTLMLKSFNLSNILRQPEAEYKNVIF